jgi:glycine betaine/proline transport system ATP-binding protein
VDAAAVFKAGDIARKTQVEVSESPTRGCRPP